MKDDKAYGVQRDDDGSSRIRFGDGVTGRRLPSGADQTSSTYRRGGGSETGNVAKQVVKELASLDKQISRIPLASRNPESKDMGEMLVEMFSTLNNIQSFYQELVQQEAYLNTDERERISKGEERVKPKLRALVAYCDRIDSKAKKRLGLSDKIILNIRGSATKLMQDFISGKCRKCGYLNAVGTARCKKCGTSL
ncbi:MAG: hypothetical protein ACFFEJ_09405 [Candidatus Thorarchaeota archaeon]